MIRLCLLTTFLGALVLQTTALCQDQKPAREALRLQQTRVNLVRKITPAVCAIFRGRGGGSGVIISPDGWVLSNFHVTSFSKTLRVGLPDHKIYKATVVGLDPTGDIALLKLHGKKRWPYAPLGNSDALQFGEWVIAAGNPFLLATDFTPTVTMGIVSGTHRFLSGAGGFRLTYPDAIATDAPINPGNSGGPLFNMAGEVVGINGRISLRDRGRVNIGAGYAISANAIKNLLGTLQSGEIVERGNMDATVRNRDGKVVFDQMFEDSAAHNAGLRIGDELVEFDGIPIKTSNQFLNRIWVLIAGWKIKVVIRRDQKLSTHWVTLSAIPQRGKKRKGDWAPLGKEHRRKRALELAASWSKYRGLRRPVSTSGTAGNAGFNARFRGFEPISVNRKSQIDLFLPAAVTRNGKELPASAARRARLTWALAPVPDELLGGSHLSRGELHSSGRLGSQPTLVVIYSGPDDEKLIFHYDVARSRLVGLERFVGEKLDLRIAYSSYRRFGSQQIASQRTITRPGQKVNRVQITAARLSGSVRDVKVEPQTIPADAPRLRPKSGLAPALKKVMPALVKIYGAGRVKGIPSYGTGVIVSPDGRILTYNSAMLTTTNLYVVLADGRYMPAKLVHRDYDRDVAIIQINGKKLPHLQPHTGDMLVGQWVVAIGNAFNLAQGSEPMTVNLGMLSAKTKLYARRGLADFPYKGEVFIIDAQINPGSFGGPLIDSAGRWIGLCGKVLHSKETNTQFHYALPVGSIKDLIAGKPRQPKPKSSLRGKRPYHGLVFLDAGPFKSPPPYVDRVLPMSPGRKAGFLKDDLILRVDERRVKSLDELKTAMRGYRPGDVVSFSVKRQDKVMRVKVTLEADEDDEEDTPDKRKTPTTRAGWLAEYTAQLREAASPYGKISAALKLAGMGQSAGKALGGLLRVKDHEIRRAVLVGIQALGPQGVAAVPDLRRILERGRGEDLRQQVAIALARIGPAALPATPDLIKLLGAPDVVLRHSAYKALVAIGPKSIHHILAALGSRSDAALRLVIQEIGKPALPSIIEILDTKPGLRGQALHGLSALGPLAVDALPKLLTLLHGKEREQRLAVIQTLGSLQDTRAAAALAKLLDSEERAVIDALESSGPSAAVAVPQLAGLLSRAQKAGRITRLLRCLGAIGKPAAPILDSVVSLAKQRKLAWLPELPRTLAKVGLAALPAIKELIVSSEPDRQQIGLAAAGLLGKKAVSLLPQILNRTSSPFPGVRRLALEVTGNLGQQTPAVSKALLAALEARRSEVVRWAAWAIGQCKIRDTKVRKRLLRLTNSLDEATQEVALHTLGQIGGPAKELAPSFLKHLTHFTPSIRKICAWSLGQLGDQLPESGIRALIEAFADEDWDVKSAAVNALSKVGKPAVLKLTLQLDQQDPTLRFLAVTALEGMGPTAAPAVQGVTKLLGDRRPEIRERAATALGRIGKTALSAKSKLIAALDDPMLDVGQAALTSLRQITGKNYTHPSEWTADRPFEQPTVKED